MAEQWEMCIVGEDITTHTPNGKEVINYKKFLKQENINGKNYHDAFSVLLSKGWEPYGVTSNFVYLFRRKHQG